MAENAIELIIINESFDTVRTDMDIMLEQILRHSVQSIFASFSPRAI